MACIAGSSPHTNPAALTVGPRQVHRPYQRHSIDELGTELKKHRTNHQVLGELRSELTYRTTPRAKQMLREVTALIKGSITLPPTPMKPPEPNDQVVLFDPTSGKRK